MVRVPKCDSLADLRQLRQREPRSGLCRAFVLAMPIGSAAHCVGFHWLYLEDSADGAGNRDFDSVASDKEGGQCRQVRNVDVCTQPRKVEKVDP